MIDYLTNFLTSSYEQGGYVTTSPETVLRLANNKKSSNTFDHSIDLMNDESLFKSKKVKEVLRNYGLTKLMLSIVSSTIADILQKSSFQISIKEADPEIVKQINEYISALNIKDHIVNSLDDILYWGNFSWYIESIGKSFRLRDMMEPTGWVLASVKGKPFKYLKDGDMLSNSVQSFSAAEIFNISLNRQPYKKVAINQNVGASALADISYSTGFGILDDAQTLMFEHMIKYLMRLLLSVKDTIRPDILVATMTSKQSGSADKVATALQNIEAMVNNGENMLDFRNVDPSAMVNIIFTAVLNQIKVVPGLESYTDLRLLEQPDFKEKLTKLAEDLKDGKSSIANIIGIPEELTEGNSNRWEAMSRSSRFLTLISSKLTSISTPVKELALNRYRVLTNDKTASNLEAVGVALDANNVISNQNFNAQNEVLLAKLRSFEEMLTTLTNISKTGLIDIGKLVPWYKEQIGSLDPTLPAVLEDDKIISGLTNMIKQESEDMQTQEQ